MSDNLVIRIARAFEKRKTLRRWVLGIRDLALQRNGGACSARADILGYAPSGDGMTLIRAKLAAQLRERLGPFVLRSLFEELRAVIRHRGVKVVGGNSLEVPCKHRLRILLVLREAAAADRQCSQSKSRDREEMWCRRFHARNDG